MESKDQESKDVCCITSVTTLIHVAAAILSFYASYEAMAYDKFNGTFLALSLILNMIGAYFLVMIGALSTIPTTSEGLREVVGIVFYLLSLIFTMGTIGWVSTYALYKIIIDKNPIVNMCCLGFTAMFAILSCTYAYIGRAYRRDAETTFLEITVSHAL